MGWVKPKTIARYSPFKEGGGGRYIQEVGLEKTAERQGRKIQLWKNIENVKGIGAQYRNYQKRR